MDHHYQNMNPPPPNPLIMHYINPPAVVHSKFFAGNPPPPVTHPSPLPTIGCFSVSPPPEEKMGHGKHKPPRLENNCTLVFDSSVCDNFDLILILVVRADNLLMHHTLEVF